MPRRKDFSNDLNEAIVAANQSGKGYKDILNTMWSPSFNSEKDYSEVGKHSSWLPVLLEVATNTEKPQTNPRTTIQTLQASVNMLKFMTVKLDRVKCNG